MPKASITLKSGTIVTIEGETEEVRQLLAFYDPREDTAPVSKSQNNHVSITTKSAASNKVEQSHEEVADLMAIVNQIKSCDEATLIEKNILDKSGQLPRIILPLYIVHEHLNNAFGLTSGEISRVTTELGTPINVANVSNSLASSASKYVMGDKVRIKGQPVRYKLSHRGVAYLNDLLAPEKKN